MLPSSEEIKNEENADNNARNDSSNDLLSMDYYRNPDVTESDKHFVNIGDNTDDEKMIDDRAVAR